MLNGNISKKMRIVFLLSLPLLVGCTDDNSQESSSEAIGENNSQGEASGQTTANDQTQEADNKVSGAVLGVFENKIEILKQEEFEEMEFEEGAVATAVVDFRNEGISIFFTDETIVELVELINGDYRNPIVSESEISHLTVNDGIDVYGTWEGNEFFADKIVVTRIVFPVS